MDDEGLLANRQILLTSLNDNDAPNETVMKLLYLQYESRKGPISLFIDCPGGDVITAMAIVDTINRISPLVHTIGLSQVAGIAVWILAAGTFGCRSCSAECSIEIVPPLASSTGDDESLERASLQLARCLSDNTRLSEGEIMEALYEGRRFSFDEALEVRIIDAEYNPPS